MISVRMHEHVFAGNLPLKLFPSTVAMNDIGSLKSFHYDSLKMFVPHAIEIEQNRMVQHIQTTLKLFWFFWQKSGILRPFCQGVDVVLEDVSVAKTVFNAKEIFFFSECHFTVFKTLR